MVIGMKPRSTRLSLRWKKQKGAWNGPFKSAKGWEIPRGKEKSNDCRLPTTITKTRMDEHGLVRMMVILFSEGQLTLLSVRRCRIPARADSIVLDTALWSPTWRRRMCMCLVDIFLCFTTLTSHICSFLACSTVPGIFSTLRGVWESWYPGGEYHAHLVFYFFFFFVYCLEFTLWSVIPRWPWWIYLNIHLKAYNKIQRPLVLTAGCPSVAGVSGVFICGYHNWIPFLIMVWLVTALICI